MTILVLLHRLF